MYRNLHKYFIDLLTSHMIQYSSGYDSRFPRNRSWFESQLRNTILYFVVVVFLFAFVVFILIFYCFLVFFNRIDNPPISAFRYKITKDSRYLYCVQKFSLFLCSHSLCLHNRAILILTPRMKFLSSKTCLQGIYYISHNLLFKMPQIASFIAHINELLK